MWYTEMRIFCLSSWGTKNNPATNIADLKWYGPWLDGSLGICLLKSPKHLRSFPGYSRKVAGLAKIGCGIEDIATRLLHLESIELKIPVTDKTLGELSLSCLAGKPCFT